jgi:hypothetical protein
VPLQKFRSAGHDPLLIVVVFPVSTAIVVPVSTGVVLVFWTSDELNCPWMQVSPKGTVKPHPPQLSGSVLRSTHFPLHRVSPSEHKSLTGNIPESPDSAVLFWDPAGSGEPENTKKTAAPQIIPTPINARTRRGNRQFFGRDCSSAGYADEKEEDAEGEFAEGEW